MSDSDNIESIEKFKVRKSIRSWWSDGGNVKDHSMDDFVKVTDECKTECPNFHYSCMQKPTASFNGGMFTWTGGGNMKALSDWGFCFRIATMDDVKNRTTNKVIINRFTELLKQTDVSMCAATSDEPTWLSLCGREYILIYKPDGEILFSCCCGRT